MALPSGIGSLPRDLSLLLLGFQAVLLCAVCQAAQFSGVVLDTQNAPVDDAIVRVQGTTCSARTDQNGNFSIVVKEHKPSKYITAWKNNFYNGGEPIVENKQHYLIKLNSTPMDDNRHYQWLPSLMKEDDQASSNDNEAAPCETCHPAIVEQWLGDAHSNSAKNPIFLSFFNGTDVDGKKGIGIGYRTDFPNADGNCAACHVPIAALSAPFRTDPNNVQGVAREGINCDFCHKISGAMVDRTGGAPGILSLTFTRPPQGDQIFYGPFDDVFPGKDSYLPLYQQSLYCAPCHNGKFWDVLVYSEYLEWASSSYARKEIHCQSCHMKSNEKMTQFALKGRGGIARDPETIRSHVNFGIDDIEFMREAISVEVKTVLEEEILEVQVAVANTKAGHHYPTGNPMRNMILLVQATDQYGQQLPLLNGPRIPDWAGIGPQEEGNYAGMPGRGYAKVLKDLMLYTDRKTKRDFSFEYPAPHWRPTLIEYDTRIPADGTDISDYRFKAAGRAEGPIYIETRLIFRRGYKKWMEAKRIHIPDMELAKTSLTIER